MPVHVRRLGAEHPQIGQKAKAEKALRQELQTMRVADLRRQAVTAGAGQAELDDADDAKTPKAALIELVIRQVSLPGSAPGAPAGVARRASRPGSGSARGGKQPWRVNGPGRGAPAKPLTAAQKAASTARAQRWSDQSAERQRLPMKGEVASPLEAAAGGGGMGRKEKKELADLRKSQAELAERVNITAAELAVQRRAHRLAVAEAQNAQLLERLNAVSAAANASLPTAAPSHWRKEMLPSGPDRPISLPLPLDALLPRAAWPSAGRSMSDMALLLTFGQ